MQMHGRHRPIPCLGCGYDITGLPAESPCPECALPLKETLEASTLLRSLPRGILKRIDGGVMALAWSPIALGGSLPLGFVLVLVWSLLNPSSATTGLTIGFLIGCGASFVCFTIGALNVSRPIPGRPMRPAWGPLMLRFVGPVAVLLAAMLSSFDAFHIDLGRTTTMVLRACGQATSLAALAATLRVLQSVERQTHRGRDATLKYWYGWGLVALLAVIWVFGYWVNPLGLALAGRPFARRSLDWGGAVLGAVMVLEIGVFWSVVDSVAVEWLAATYGEGAADEARTIAP